VTGRAAGAGRFGLALVAEVDEFSNMGNCRWVAATRALRMTGVKHYATLGDLMRASGLTMPAEMGGAFADEVVPALRLLGADARVVVEAADSMDTVVKAANADPSGVIMFSVERTPPGTAQSVGHTLLAQRQLFGGVKLLDRSGKVLFDTLTQVEAVGYEGISTARVYGPAVAVQNTLAVQILGVAPTLANSLAVEVKSVAIPNPYDQNYTSAGGVCR
jgi:hypothetical protein